MHSIAERAATTRDELTSTPVLLGAAGVAALDTVARWAVVPAVGTNVRFVGVAVVAAAVVLGRSGRWAVAGGLYVSTSLLGAPFAGIAWAAAGFVAAAVGSRLWTPPESWDGDRRLRWYARYATMTAAVVFALAATAAWALELVGRASFRVTVGPVLWANLAGALLCAPIVRQVERRVDAAQRRASGEDRASEGRRASEDGRRPDDRRRFEDRRTSHVRRRPARPLRGTARTATVAVLLGWVVLGYATSYGFAILAETSHSAVTARLPGAVAAGLALFGDRGQYAILLLGLVALALLAFVDHRCGSDSERGSEHAGQYTDTEPT